MNGAIIGVFLVIIAYLVMMLAIGFFYSKGNNDSSDFYLGGRKLGPFVTAMSAEASDMSSWLLMGLPGVAYLSGTCDAAWTAIGLAIGTAGCLLPLRLGRFRKCVENRPGASGKKSGDLPGDDPDCEGTGM